MGDIQNIDYYKIKYHNKLNLKTISDFFNIQYAPRYNMTRSSFLEIIYLNRKSHGVFIYPSREKILL